MSSNNNYISNMEPQLPKRLTGALGEMLASIELQAALVSKGGPPETEIEQHLAEFVRIIDEDRPEQRDKILLNMQRPLEIMDRNLRFEPFRKRDLSLDDIRAVDLTARHKPVLSEIAQGWVHIPPEVFGAHIEETPEVLDIRQPVFLPQSPYRGLNFYLHKVKCIDETGRGWWGELGRDEIHCGAVAVDENGQTSSGGLFKVGDFNDGDVRDYGHLGKRLQHFNLHEGGDTFPKVYTMAIGLVEHDWGRLREWYDRLLDIIREKVTNFLAALAGTAVGSSLGPLGAMIGAAIGFAVGHVIGIVKNWLGDENMGTKTISATINSYSGNWVGSNGPVSNLFTRDYRAHNGHYRIWWRLELVR